MSKTWQRSGITLLELMCAIVMTSFLILGLSHISLNVFRCKDQVDKWATECTETVQLRHLLEFDLTNSRSLDFSPRRLTLLGCGSKSARGRFSWGLVVVVYEQKRVNGRWFLLRHEFPAMSESKRSSPVSLMQPERTDIVGQDIRRLDVLRFQLDGRRGVELAQNGPKWLTQIWDEHQVKSISPPTTLRIRIYKFGMDDPWMDEVFCTRLNAEG